MSFFTLFLDRTEKRCETMSAEMDLVGQALLSVRSRFSPLRIKPDRQDCLSYNGHAETTRNMGVGRAAFRVTYQQGE